MHSHHCDESVVTENPGSYEVVEEEDQPGLGDRSLSPASLHLFKTD